MQGETAELVQGDTEALRRTAPAQKISLMHHGCVGGRGSEDGIADAEADALATAVDMGVVTTDELVADEADVLSLAGRAPTARRRANESAT